MGAVLGDSDGRPPLHVDGGNELQPIGYELPVASAQVKSCILLAGLYAATGPTTVIEPVPTRDHTERLLRAAGARVAKGPRTVSVWPVERLELGCGRRARRHLLGRAVPRRRDAAGRVAPVHPRHVVNPTRTGLLTVLERMGARINLFNRRTTSGGEPIADVEVHPAELVATEIERRDRARADRRAAAAGARGDDGARPHGRARRGRAARQGVEPPRDGRRAAARDRRPRARDRRRLGDPGRAGAARRAAASTPTATTASACSAPSRASSRATACASTAPRRSASRIPASPPSSSAWRCGRGDRDRRAGRRRQVDRRAHGRGRARLPLPRHGRDVPRRHAGGAAQRRRQRGRRRHSPASRAWRRR